MRKVPVVLRSAYDYDVDVASDEAGLVCPEDEGKTQQQFAEEVDINTIVRRFGLTGELPGDFEMPQSGDFSGITDFHTAMNAVREAEEMFMLVPADIRARFNHDAGKFIAFFDDPGNRDEALKLGLLKPPPEKTRDVVQAVDELAKVLTPKA
nr:MAG: internal scaffolding protein [Microvirus sp.]